LFFDPSDWRWVMTVDELRAALADVDGNREVVVGKEGDGRKLVRVVFTPEKETAPVVLVALGAE